LHSWKYGLLSFAALESLLIMSNLVLFSFDTPDLMMAGAATFAILCGIALMGGRSVVGTPLRMLLVLCGRNLHREPVLSAMIPHADEGDEQDARGTHRPFQHVA
jgi:hypothetical protein